MGKQIRIGLFGLGTVGGGLVNIIERRKQRLMQSAGVELSVVKAVVRNPSKKRACNTEGMMISTRHESILEDESIDLVVELIGGTDDAYRIVRGSLESGKPVVSANKALLAKHGQELTDLARSRGVSFFAEAAVGGGMPILKTLRESMVANRITSLAAIINGTTNFILTKMEEEGLSYYEALKLAGEMGFAEADPTLDVEGIDAQQKLRILAAHILGGTYPKGEILCEGITRIDEHDFAFARRQGYAIKLLALARRWENDIELRVHPTLISRLHPLASVRNEFNAVFLNGDAVGEVMLAGRGAGSFPTASAVYADIVDVCTRTQNPSAEPEISQEALGIVPPMDVTSEYYICFTIDDKPGIIGEIATILGTHGISVSSITAELIPNAEGLGRLDIIVHKSKEKAVRDAVAEVAALGRVHGEGKFIRIERGLN